MNEIVKELLKLNGISVSKDNKLSYKSYNLVIKEKSIIRKEFIPPTLTEKNVDKIFTIYCDHKTKSISKRISYLNVSGDELKDVVGKIDEKLRQRKSREYVPKIEGNIATVLPDYCWKDGWVQFIILGYKYKDRRINFIGCIINEKDFYCRKENLFSKNDVELEDWVGPMNEKEFEAELDCFNDLIELHKLGEG